MLADPGELVISWSDDLNPFNANMDDEVMVVIFDPATNIYLSRPMSVTRVEAVMNIPIPAAYLGNTVHVYMFYMSREGKLSNSVYVG